jgi:general secretion pathway protein G
VSRQACRRDEARADARRRDAAFTLIELMLVLVILATLAAIVVPKFAKRSEQAKIAAARTQIENLGTAFALYEIDNGSYPTTQEGLAALSQMGPQGTRYLERSVENDPWGRPYVYRCPGMHNTDGYDLYSFGPDGMEGTDDDIDNWSAR